MIETAGTTHSIFSFVTISTALPGRLIRNKGSRSQRCFQRRARVSIPSMASCPSLPLTLRISSSQDFMEAVTASLTCVRSDGKDDSKCVKNGVCDRDVGGIVCISSRVYEMGERHRTSMAGNGPATRSSICLP